MIEGNASRMRAFEVLYYNGLESPPCYHVVGLAEGRFAKQALKQSLASLIESARQELSILDEVTDEEIAQSIFLLKDDGLVSVSDLAGR